MKNRLKDGLSAVFDAAAFCTLTGGFIVAIGSAVVAFGTMAASSAGIVDYCETARPIVAGASDVMRMSFAAFCAGGACVLGRLCP